MAKAIRLPAYTATACQEISTFLIELADKMQSVANALDDNNEDLLADTLDAFPSNKEITKKLVLLGKLLDKISLKRAKHG